MDVVFVGDGPTTVLALHGIQGTRDAWLPVAERLSSRFRFVLPNLRGRGAARRCSGAGEHDLRSFASDVRAVAESHLQGVPFALAGWSMGVSVALDYVAQARGPQPAKLALLSGTPKLCAARWFRGEGEALLCEIAAREARLGLRHAADHDAVAWTWQAIRDSDQRPLLGRVRQPALLLHGVQDEDSPWAHAVELSSALPDATLVPIEGAGHSLLTSHTARVADALLRFLDPLEYPR